MFTQQKRLATANVDPDSGRYGEAIAKHWSVATQTGRAKLQRICPSQAWPKDKQCPAGPTLDGVSHPVLACSSQLPTEQDWVRGALWGHAWGYAWGR